MRTTRCLPCHTLFRCAQVWGDVGAGVEAGYAPGDGAVDARGGQLADRRQHPLALFVELADHARAGVGAPVVELLLHLVLDDRALLLDDQDLFQALGKAPDALALQRPGHRSEEHTSELQSLMRISYAVVCLKKKTPQQHILSL